MKITTTIFYFSLALVLSRINNISCFNFPNRKINSLSSLQRQTKNHFAGSRFNHVSSLQSSSSMDDEFEKIENARKMFENLVKKENLFKHPPTPAIGQSHSKNKMPTKKEDYIPILTESSKHRREVEMILLKSLETSNEAIEPLVNFWLVERDHESAKKLKDMERYCSPGHEREEKFLRETIAEYGIDWVEPMSRLALLLYSEGRTAECEYWCKIALAVKPWHFEVIQVLIMNALEEKKNNPDTDVQQWRDLALPPLTEPEKRKAWVKQARKDARDVIARGERAKQEAIQKARMVMASPINLKSIIPVDNAWQ